MADSLEECIARLKVWKEGMERKGLRVNMKKTKLMVSGPRLDLLCDSGAFPCAVCHKEGLQGSKSWIPRRVAFHPHLPV